VPKYLERPCSEAHRS